MTITTKTAKSYNEAMELVKEFHAKRPDCYFVYDSENYGESRKNNTIYRFFDGMGKDGYGICFAMIEIVKDGKLETVRVINTFRDTAIDIKIEIEPKADEAAEIITNVEPPADNFTTELAKLEAAKLEAEAKEQAAKAVYKAAADETEKHRVELQNFLDSHASRLCNKLQALTPTQRMTLITTGGTREFCRDFTDLYVDAPNLFFGRRFSIAYYNGRKLAHYDTPAQVETVINMLKAAIERGEKIFTFPTVEQFTVSVELEIIKARKHEVVIELCELRTALEETGADEETPQRHIDYLKDRIESLTAEYDELWDKLFALKNQKGVA